MCKGVPLDSYRYCTLAAGDIHEADDLGLIVEIEVVALGLDGHGGHKPRQPHEGQREETPSPITPNEMCNCRGLDIIITLCTSILIALDLTYKI